MSIVTNVATTGQPDTKTVESVLDTLGNVMGLAGTNGYEQILGSGDTPILMLGGDHPYQQWLAGQLPLYQATGVKPYLAINTRSSLGISPQNYDPGSTDMLSWAQVKALQQTVDIHAHGARHIQGWMRINTGFWITYAGANGTATVAISATQLTCTDSGANNFTLASYTLATLQTAVNALTGWTMTLAPELSGLEPAANLTQIAATSVKSVVQPFACGGAIAIKYNGTAYREVTVYIVSNTLKIYGDGILVASHAINAGAKLSDLVTAFNAAVTGLVCVLCDNQKVINAAFLSFVSGNELAAGLSILGSAPQSCMEDPLILQLGLAAWYIAERNITTCIVDGAANNVTLSNFSSSGNEFIRSAALGHQGYSFFRGDALDTIDSTLYTNQPHPVPSYISDTFLPKTTLTSGSYTTLGEITAVFDALATSPGFCLNLLMHKVLADGSSPYNFYSTDTSYYDQTETIWVAAMNYLATNYLKTGLIKSVYPKDMLKLAQAAAKPKNLIFNSLFKNSGEALVGSTSNAVAIPGWQLNATAAQFTSITIDANGQFVCTINGTGEYNPLGQFIWVEPGKTYDMGFYVNISGYTAGNGVSLEVNNFRGYQWNGWDATQTNISRSNLVSGNGGFVKMRYTVPPEQPFGMATIRSVSFGAGIDMSTNKNINLNIYAKGVLTIDLSAGSALNTSVKAYEAANAINAAIVAAFATYPAELQKVAYAEDGKLTISIPKKGPDGSFVLSVVAGTTVSITSTVFGSNDCYATTLSSFPNPYMMPLNFAILTTTNNGAVVSISRPFCEEVRCR